jgi:hypothetical protein
MLLTVQPDAIAARPDAAAAAGHQAFAFDGADYLAAVARTVGAATSSADAALAQAARLVVARASPRTQRVLAALRFDPSWLVAGPEGMTARWLVVMLAEHLDPIPSLGGGDAPSWQVLDRLAMRSTAAASALRRLVHGDPWGSLPAALRRPDLAPLFSGARDPGGILAAPEASLLALSLNRMEDLFRGSTVAEAAAFADWAYTRTPQLLARAKARAFTDARQMLAAADGRSIFMRFEPWAGS